MKFSTFLSKLKALEDHEVFRFWDKDFEAACPCFMGSRLVDGKRVYVHGRCWRVSKNDQDLYVWGDLSKDELTQVAAETKRALDETKWYAPYTVIYKVSE